MTIGEITTTPEEWHVRFLDLAAGIASWSKDPDRKTGAIIVNHRKRIVGHGYNGFPAGVVDLKTRMKDAEEKLALTVHAELNAILNTFGSVEGCTLYTTSYPCHECAKAIVQAGIEHVITPPKRAGSSWEKSWKYAADILNEGGVTVWQIEVEDGSRE